MLMWILTVLAIIKGVRGYADGYFPESCESMLVQHSIGSTPIEPQTPSDLYTILVSPGQPIKVTLKTTQPSAYFKGFMLEARSANPRSNHPVGKFTVIDTETTLPLTCNGVEASAVSNSNNQRKTEVSVTWTSTGPEEYIIFKATFLQDFVTFWAPIKTGNISLIPSTTSTTTPTTTTVTVTPTSTTEVSTTPTTKPSTSTSTTELSTPTTRPSTSTSTTELSSTATMEPSTTAGTEPITSTSPTELGTQPDIATTTTPPTRTPPSPLYVCMIIVLVIIALILNHAKMAKIQFVTVVCANSGFSFRLNKVSKISFNVVCLALVTATLIIVREKEQDVKVLALVCVAFGFNLLELVICCLSIGHTHELKEICDTAAEVCSFFCNCFTIAFLFVVVSRFCQNLMAGYTILVFLYAIAYCLIKYKRPVLRRSTRDSSSSEQHSGQTRKEKQLSVAGVAVIVVSVLFIAGSVAFAVAIMCL